MLLPLCLLALAFSLTAAAPGGVHRIEAVHRPIARESPKHQQRLERMRASTSGQVPVADYYFYELLVNVNLGTPAQSFLVELDPYTSDWWVIGADAPFVDQDGERVKSRFNASQSTSFVNTTTRFSAFYGFVDGWLGKDTFAIGSLTLPATTFGVADNVTSWYSYYVEDGTFGIQVTSNTSTPLYQVLSQLDKPIISLYVNGTGFNYLTNGTGVVTLGGEDTVTCGPTYTYLPFSALDSWSYWSLPLGNVTIGGQVVANTTQGLAVLTDFLGFYTSNNTATAIATLYGGTYNASSDSYDVDCGQITNSAVNTATVGLSFNSGDANAPTVLTLSMEDFFVNDAGTCYLAVHPHYSDGSDDVWFIGHPFMTNRCLAVNPKDHTAGFSHVVAH